MPTKPDYYDFAGIRLFTSEIKIKLLATGIDLFPSKNHYGFLLALAENSPGTVSYEKLWNDVWRASHYDETSRHTIQTTKGQFLDWLKTARIENLEIKADPGAGYFLPCAVKKGWYLPPETESSSESEKNTFEYKKELDWRSWVTAHSGFIFSISLFYGFLFAIASVMEISYQFDIFGMPASIGGFFLLLINSSAMIAALGAAAFRLARRQAAFIPAAGILTAAAVISIIFAAFYIPLEPITEADFQTQPALVAFGKNALLYFLPLGVIFLLSPFYVICLANLKQIKQAQPAPGNAIGLSPFRLLVICAGIMVYSFLTTNYMLDRLNAESDYHALFVALVMLRTLVYFGLAISSIVWYQKQSFQKERILSTNFNPTLN